jgi:adenylate kinase family enzyme
MRIAVTGPSGSGKTTLAVELARRLGLRHVEIDALHHGPNWESCGEDVLRDRVLAATEGDGWVTDSLYHHMLGDLIPDRSDLIVWLDLPVTLVMWRLVGRTYRRKRDRTVLWNGNVEPGWAESAYYLLWPALRRAFENRRQFPARFAHRNMTRLRSDAEVLAFLQSIQPTESTSGSSSARARQNTPPVVET